MNQRIPWDESKHPRRRGKFAPKLTLEQERFNQEYELAWRQGAAAFGRPHRSWKSRIKAMRSVTLVTPFQSTQSKKTEFSLKDFFDPKSKVGK